MPAEYTVELEGIEEIDAYLARFPQIVQEETGDAMRRAVFVVRANVQRETPRYQGRLVSSIGGRVESVFGGRVEGVVYSDLEYAVPVELGRQPGSFPPLEPIRRWCHLVLGDESLAFVVARKIATVGTRPRAMFAKGWLASKAMVSSLFQQALARIVARIRR